MGTCPKTIQKFCFANLSSWKHKKVIKTQINEYNFIPFKNSNSMHKFIWKGWGGARQGRMDNET